MSTKNGRSQILSLFCVITLMWLTLLTISYRPIPIWPIRGEAEFVAILCDHAHIGDFILSLTSRCCRYFVIAQSARQAEFVDILRDHAHIGDFLLSSTSRCCRFLSFPNKHGPFGTILGSFGPRLGNTGAHLGPFGASKNNCLEISVFLGPVWGILGPIWGHLGLPETAVSPPGPNCVPKFN